MKGIGPVQLWVDFIAIVWDTNKAFYYLRIHFVNIMDGKLARFNEKLHMSEFTDNVVTKTS